MAFKDRIKKALQQGKKEVQAPPTTAESFKQFLATKQQSEPKIFNNATNWMMNSAINQRNANRTARQTATQNVRNAERTVQPVASTKSDLTGNTTVRQNTQISDEEMKKMFKKANPNATDIELDTYVRNAKANGGNTQLMAQATVNSNANNTTKNTVLEATKQNALAETPQLAQEKPYETGEKFVRNKKTGKVELKGTVLKEPQVITDLKKAFSQENAKGWNLFNASSMLYKTVTGGAEAVGETAKDTGVSILKGIAGMGEGIDDFKNYAYAQMVDWASNLTKNEKGKDDLKSYATDIREEASKSGEWLTNIQEWQDDANRNSALGKKGEQAGEAIGSSIPTMALDVASGGLGKVGQVLGKSGLVGMAISSAGNSLTESYQKRGKLDALAWAKAGVDGVTTYGTEEASGLLGKGITWDNKLATNLNKYIDNSVAKTLTRLNISSMAEGTEEIEEYFANKVTNSLMNTILNFTGDDGARYEGVDSIDMAEAVDNYVMGYISAFLTQGATKIGQIGINSRGSNIKETLDQMSAQEEANAQKEIEETNLKNTEKSLEKAIKKEKSPDLINYLTEQLNAVKGQIESLNAPATISEQFKQVLQGRNAQDVIQENMSLSEQVSQPVQRAVDLVNDTLESTVQANAQYFKSDADRQKFLNYGKGIQAITEQAGNPVKVLLDTTVGGDGLITINNADGTRAILVNPSMSNQSMEETLVHELFHNVKNTDEFKQIGETLDNFVKKFKIKDSQGNLITLDNAKKQLQERYENYYKQHGLDTSTLDIDEESHAFLLQKIIGDEKTLNNLTKQQPKIVQAIYDFVDRISMRLKGLDKDTANTIIDLRNKLGNALKNNGIEVADTIKNAVSQDTIQGLEGYSRDEIKRITNDYIKDVLLDNALDDVEIVDSEIHGSRNRGTARADSDLDLVVEYSGDVREDTLFDILNSEPLEIDGIKVDINPIRADKTGTLAEYMKRSNEYDKQVMQKASLSTDTVEGKGGTLLATHNLSAEKLKGVLDLGGLPVPSIAITNQPHTQFGDISLVFDKSTIDPSVRANEVYDRDVWSPTFPEVNYDISNENIKKYVTNGLDIDTKDSIISSVVNRYMYESNLSDLVNRYGKDKTLELLRDSNELKYFYAKTVSKDNFLPIMKQANFSNSNMYSNKELQKFLDQYTGEKPLNELSYDETLALEGDIKNIIREAYNEDAKKLPSKEMQESYKKLSEEVVDKFTDNYNLLNNFIYSANSMQRNGKDFQVIDEDATLKNMDSIIDKQAYEQWVDNTFGEMLNNVSKGIRNDKDPYTASGNRRKFSQLYDEYNLANLVKALTKGETKAGQKTFFEGGFGKTSAELSQKFKSIKDIKNAENRLKNNEEIKPVVEELTDKFNNDLRELLPYYNSKYYDNEIANYMAGFENIQSVIQDFASEGFLNSNALKDKLDSYGVFETSKIKKEVLDTIIDDLYAMKEIPTDYFEAKPQRAVGLDEIKAVVVPNNLDSNLRQQLQEKGMKIIEYNPDIEGDREAKIKSADLDQYRFSVNEKNNNIWNNFLDQVDKQTGEKNRTYFKQGETKAKLPVNARYSVSADDYKQQANDLIDKANIPNKDKTSFKDSIKNIEITEQMIPELKDTLKIMEENTTEKLPTRNPRQDLGYFKKNSNDNLLEQIDQEVTEQKAKEQAKKEAKEKGETRPKLPANKISENNFKKQVEENKASKYKGKAERYYIRAKNNFINGITDRLDISKGSNKQLLNETIDKIENAVREQGEITSQERDILFDEMFNNLIKIDDDYYNEYKDLKNDIAKQKIFVDEQAVKNIASSYDGFNNFRKANFGNLNLSTKEGTGIDRIYQELSSAYGNLFPDNIYNTSEQLEYIADVVKDIKKSEMNLSSYDDKALGGELRQYARQEFDGFVDDLINEYNRTERYKEDRRQSEIDRKKQTKSSTEETKSKYSQLPELKRQYEKASSNELLTDRDRIELDRLFKGEITLDDINPGLNRKGIEKVYKAGKKYKQLTQQLNTDRANIKKGYLSKANDIIGDLSQWKDKGQGIRYTRETAVRNFLDIAPKDIAERINDEYIYKYGENEANRTRFINEQTQKVKDLKLSNKKKYNATFDIQERDSNGNLVDKKTTRKVSEAELVQIYGEHRMSRDDLINTGVDVNKIDNAVNTFRNIYNEMLDMTNNVLIETGHAPIPKREDYFPHFEEGQDTTLQKVGKVLGIDLTGKELPTNIAGQTQNFKPDKTWVGNFLERKTNITDFNVLKGFDRYINGVSDVIYHTEDIMKMRGLETAVRQFYADDKIKERIQRVLENPDLTEDERYEEVRLITNQTLDKTHLSNFINWYGDYVNSLAGKKTISDRGIEKELSRKHYQAINKIQSRYSANAIGGNVSVALTNLGVIASASGETNPIFLIKGAYDTAKNSVKSIFGKGDDSLVSMSDFLTNRRGVDTAYTSMLDKATMPINAFINSFDNLSTEIVVRSKYLQNLHEGMTQYEALENADNFARGLISDRSKGMLPTQFNKTNPVAKLMNAFQVEANNQISYLVKDLNRNVRDKAERQGWSKSKTAVKLTEAYTGLFVGNFLINSLLSSVRGNSTRVLIDPIYMLSELVKGFIDDDEENDKETVQNVFEEIIGQLPFTQVPVALFGDAFGLDSERIGRVPIAGAVPNVSKAVKSWTYTDKEGNKHISDARYILQENWKELQKPLLNLALPYGGMQLKKTANAIDTMVKGEKTKVDSEGKESIKYITYDKSILNDLKAVMLGDTARSEYQEYAENGYKGLNAKQTELYRNSKIPYKALLDYTKTQFKSDKDENGKVIKNSLRNKKIDYIEGMDISDEQKIDMYKYDVFSKEQMETGEKIQEEGGNANAYYNYLRGTIKMESEKDKNGDAISGSLKAKKVEWILNSDLSREDKNNIIREEFSTDNNVASISDYNKINKDYDTLLYYNNLQEESKKEFKEIAKAGVDQKKYIDYKKKVSKLTKQGKKTATKDDDINNAKKCKLLRQSGLSNKDKATVYEMDLGKNDTTYQQLKSTKVKIDEYLKYKEANLKADREDDGTVNGKAISGSLKAKKVEFINNMNITYEQKLLLMGKDYKLSTQERSYLANYINGLKMTRKEKLDLYGSLKGFTVYKDGRVTW